ncbi:hypothetical protein HDE_04473 [Halotydeus destructor]|nr:hypothetical protein HDE_04473 [Halotydeus destructor]
MELDLNIDDVAEQLERCSDSFKCLFDFVHRVKSQRREVEELYLDVLKSKELEDKDLELSGLSVLGQETEVELQKLKNALDQLIAMEKEATGRLNKLGNEKFMK